MLNAKIYTLFPHSTASGRYYDPEVDFEPIAVRCNKKTGIGHKVVYPCELQTVGMVTKCICVVLHSVYPRRDIEHHSMNNRYYASIHCTGGIGTASQRAVCLLGEQET